MLLENYYLGILVLIFLNYIFIKKIDFFSKTLNIYDFPDNKRKIHTKPVPLIGGLIIYINIILFIIFTYFFLGEKSLFNILLIDEGKQFIYFIFSITIIFFIGLYDDKIQLDSFKKLVILFFIIFLTVNSDDVLNIAKLRFSFTDEIIVISNSSVFFSTLCILVLIVAVNMFDGVNLNCLSYIFIIFCLINLKLNINIFFIFLSLVIIILIFLNYNSKIFLGDSGAYLLAYILGYYLIKMYNQGYIIEADRIIVYLFVPVLDMIRVIFNRIFILQSPLASDRIHLHHYILKKFKNNSTLLLSLINFFPILLVEIIGAQILLSFYILTFCYFTIFFYLKRNV